MTWTDETPTEPGPYWHRNKGQTYAHILEVSPWHLVKGQPMHVQSEGTCEDIGGQWSGPILEPETEEEYVKQTNVIGKKLQEIGLTTKQGADVWSAIESTCHDCWDAEIGCQCWNDE